MSGGPHLVLIGPPGVGKSSVAAAVAERTGRLMIDTDELVERRAGRAVSDIFLEEGESAFRSYEEAAVREALQTQGSVLALGGGAPMTAGIARAIEELAQRRVLFLDVGIADAARRIGLDRSRPLLAVNPRATWVQTMQTRRPTYERLATWQVDTAGRDLDAVVEEVLAVVSTSQESS